MSARPKLQEEDQELTSVLEDPSKFQDDHSHKEKVEVQSDLEGKERYVGEEAIEKDDLVGRSRLDKALAEEGARLFRRSFLRLYACIFVAYLCSATNGFDANTFGGLTAMPNFTTYFHITPTNQGLVAALYVLGNVIGCLFAGPAADAYGRRLGMFLGSLTCLAGTLLQALSHSLPVFCAGRFVLGLGAALVQTAGPAYVVEIAYPTHRGVLTGLYQTCFFLGTIVSTWAEYALSYLPNPGQIEWRIPLAIQGIPSVLVIAFVWLIPETPRWHVSRGHLSTARDVLVRYHGDGDPNSAVVGLELEDMRRSINVNGGSDKRWWDYRELFNSRSSRYRTYLIVCIAFFGQWDLPPTSYYFPLMARTAGITSSRTQLLLNALQTPIMMAAALSGLRFMDRFGRRPLLITSSTCMSVSVAFITAFTAVQSPENPALGAAGISFVYVFLVVFAFAWTPAQSLYPTEVLAYNARAKGLALMNLLINIANVVNTYAPPAAIARAGWRFYLFYVIWDLLGAVVIWATFVETKGRNLEEIDEIFESPGPKRKSLQKRGWEGRDVRESEQRVTKSEEDV